MRERNREINRRQHRHMKRKKLRKKLEAAATEQERGQLLQRIRKTIPKFVLEG